MKKAKTKEVTPKSIRDALGTALQRTLDNLADGTIEFENAGEVGQIVSAAYNYIDLHQRIGK